LNARPKQMSTGVESSETGEITDPAPNKGFSFEQYKGGSAAQTSGEKEKACYTPTGKAGEL